MMQTKLSTQNKNKPTKLTNYMYIGMLLSRFQLTWDPITGAAKLGGALLRTLRTCQKQDLQHLKQLKVPQNEMITLLYPN